MFSAIILGLFILIISYLQLEVLFRNHHNKEGWVFIGLMIIASYLSIGLLLDLNIPNPKNGIQSLFEPIQHIIDNLLS